MWGSSQQKGTARHASVTPAARGGSRKRSLASGTAVLVVATGLGIGGAEFAGAWQFQKSATVDCVDGSAVIKGLFKNTEAYASGDMKVTMKTPYGNDGPKVVLHGDPASFEVNTASADIPAGTVTFEMKWKDGRPGTDTTTATYPAKSCGDEDTDKKMSFCHATGSQSNPYVYLTTAREVFYQAGHVDHKGDIYPAGSFVKNGKLVKWDAQGDQSLLDTECKLPTTKIEIPATPTFMDPCGPDNATWNKPEDTDVLDWEVLQNGHLTVSILKDNTTFSDGTTSHDYGTAPDSGKACVTKIEIPATPTFMDPCGPDNATWNKPEDTDVLDWEVLQNGHLTVSILKDNTTFSDGTTSHDYGTAPDSGKACVNTPERPKDVYLTDTETKPACDGVYARDKFTHIGWELVDNKWVQTAPVVTYSAWLKVLGPDSVSKADKVKLGCVTHTPGKKTPPNVVIKTDNGVLAATVASQAGKPQGSSLGLLVPGAIGGGSLLLLGFGASKVRSATRRNG